MSVTTLSHVFMFCQFQSHQIFHMFVVAAAIVHLYGMYVVASNRPIFEQYCIHDPAPVLPSGD